MAVVRERRLPQLTLTLDLPGGNRTCLPLPPSIPTAPTAVATTTSEQHRITDFEKLEVLGHGNGGTVYKARHRRTSALYALKLIQVADLTARRQATREVEILRSAADHPSIIRCHGVVSLASGDIAVLLDLMDAGSLESLLRRRGGAPLPEPALAEIARQALLGLSHLHAHQIAHRDIKPSNLLINAAGEIKIADFGVSKIVRRSLDPCVSYVGTCAYMSPERFDPVEHGGGYDGYAGDVWGLGLTLMEMGTGRFPLVPEGERANWAGLMWAICFGEPPTIPESSEASPELRDFVARCLEREAGERWTVAQLLGHPFVAGADAAESKRALTELLRFDSVTTDSRDSGS
ncbi:Mitogen-activated protein kinase kinase protein [Dioscorea alata]|uniref:Mitogen-activated protein kinase kinase protein n=1 Tax=Dioscorea alata TaxID=55571 RepID=A0ACB7VY28_DIOAL|nr:Mitogen-activated protein kinase kinase protein [Dioscorea alata]